MRTPDESVLAHSVSELGELVLRRRTTDDGEPVLELRANGVFVMDTAETSTERDLATRALRHVADPQDVLIGGLGLGFTLAQVLADDRVRRIRVAELEPALVGWMREGTIPHGPSLLADRRVEVVVDDVKAVIEAAPAGSFDLVLLDVDNGPDYLVHDANASLYASPFLASTKRSLKPGGVCVVWSATRSQDLLNALTEVFGAAEAVPGPVRLGQRDESYWLHLADSPPSLDVPGVWRRTTGLPEYRR